MGNDTFQTSLPLVILLLSSLYMPIFLQQNFEKSCALLNFSISLEYYLKSQI